MFNIREGWTRSDDTLPPRVTSEVLPTGVSQGVGLSISELEVMIESYYSARGWSKDGSIPSKKIAELGLSDIMSM
jgi:aldehyde:ferredoxin oxidoreductase